MQRQKSPSGSSAQCTTRKRHYEGAVRGAETLDINISIFPHLLLARKWACVGGTPGLCHKHTWVLCCTQEPTNLTPPSTEPAQPITVPYQAVSGQHSAGQEGQRVEDVNMTFPSCMVQRQSRWMSVSPLRWFMGPGKGCFPLPDTELTRSKISTLHSSLNSFIN